MFKGYKNPPCTAFTKILRFTLRKHLFSTSCLTSVTWNQFFNNCIRDQLHFCQVYEQVSMVALVKDVRLSCILCFWTEVEMLSSFLLDMAWLNINVSTTSHWNFRENSSRVIAATFLDFSEKETDWVIFNNYWLTVDSAAYITRHLTLHQCTWQPSW